MLDALESDWLIRELLMPKRFRVGSPLRTLGAILSKASLVGRWMRPQRRCLWVPVLHGSMLIAPRKLRGTVL